MYQVEIKIQFRSGHRLMPPYEGHCNNLHGEGYTAICIFEKNKLDKNGMVFDFGVVKKKVRNWLLANWDHAYIHHYKDEIGKFLKEKGMRTFDMPSNPTAENMANMLYNVIKTDLDIKEIKKVGIIESFDDSIAWYEE